MATIEEKKGEGGIIDPLFLINVNLQNVEHQLRVGMDNIQIQINQLKAKLISLERKIGEKNGK